MNVDDLDFTRFRVDALDGVGVIANDMALAEKREGTGEEVVEIRGDDQSCQALLAKQMGKTEVGMRNGLADNQLPKVSLPLYRIREGSFKPVRVNVHR